MLESSIIIHFSSGNMRTKREAGPSEYEECFNVSIIPDLIFEEDERFFLRLTSTDPSVLFSSNSTEIVILDNDGNSAT